MATTGTITTRNPSSGEVLRTYPVTTWEEIEAVLDAATDAQRAWGTTSFTARGDVLREVARRLRARREELAVLISSEMGKPVVEARAEVEKCALTCDFYADRAEDFLAPETITTSAGSSWVAYEPLGTVLAIMPWNFPLWQVIRFAAPALMAGNAAVLKHSPNTSGCALVLADLFLDAGVPRGLFASILVAESDVPAVTERMISDDRIAAVTATGSGRAGAAIGAAAGRAIKKSVLELGGSDPFVVLDDANLEATVAMAVRSRYLNAGQSCIAAKRFIISEEMFESFSGLFTAAVAGLRVGDPTDESTQIGPIAREDLLTTIDRQVCESVEAGAQVLTGGNRIAGPGYFYAPTVITNISPTMPVWSEETFGPVGVLISASSDDHAVELANATSWGLGASVWTSDTRRGRGIAARLKSGVVFVNAIVASDPRLPFGGSRRSGYGRELSGAGIREFVNTRSWWVDELPNPVGTVGAE